MNESVLTRAPEVLPEMIKETNQLGFTMGSEPQLGALLRMLVAAKPAGNFLEIGTGTGLATCWIAQGMDPESTLTTVDLDCSNQEIAQEFLGPDARINFLNGDARDFLLREINQFDLIFADTYIGKFKMFDVTVSLLKIGGVIVMDDFLPQTSWPDNHQEVVDDFLLHLSGRKDLVVAPLLWSSGVVLATRVS